MLPSGAKLIRTNLPNRLELLLRCVCAFPNASKTGLACRICLSSRPKRPLAVSAEGDVMTDLRLTDCERGSPELKEELEDKMEGERECDECTSVAIAARY